MKCRGVPNIHFFVFWFQLGFLCCICEASSVFVPLGSILIPQFHDGDCSPPEQTFPSVSFQCSLEVDKLGGTPLFPGQERRFNPRNPQPAGFAIDGMVVFLPCFQKFVWISWEMRSLHEPKYRHAPCPKGAGREPDSQQKRFEPVCLPLKTLVMEADGCHSPHHVSSSFVCLHLVLMPAVYSEPLGNDNILG